MDALALARLLRQIPEPTQANPDYDYAGYVAKYGVPDQSKGQHLTDEFKLPEHPTFSTYSSYASPDIQGGQWQSGGTDRWQFTPSEQNLRNMSAGALGNYFQNYERKNTFVKLPDGTLVEGTK